MRKRTTISWLALAAAMAPALAAAQTSGSGGGGSPGAQTEDNTVTEIVVTAQKREQSLQDVPIVVTAIGQQLLQDTGVKDIKDLMQVTPGLMVNSTANESNTTARIRGVGTVGDNPGLESSVGFVIDGVYRPRASTGIGDLGELQRVEVLKGPQGTLFGKNTSAGVINVITAAPSFEFGANGEVSLGNYGSKEISASVTGPLVGDTLAGRLFVSARKRDGFYEDVRRGNGNRATDYDQNRNYYTVRGQLLWEPTDTLSIKGIADFTQRNEICCAAVSLITGPSTPFLSIAAGTTAKQSPPNPEDRIAYANRGGPNDTTDYGASVEINWDTPWLNNATLTSVTAARKWNTVIGQDSDFSAADLAYRNKDLSTTFEQFSQEFRVAGAAGRLNWLAGFFFANEKLEQISPFIVGNDLDRFLSLRFSNGASSTFLSLLSGLPVGQTFPANASTLDTYNQDSNTYALFTNNSYDITDKLELTVGLRYTWEDKSLDAAYRNFGTGAGCAASVARQAQIAALIGAANVATYLGTVCATFNDPGFRAYNSTQSYDQQELTGTAKLAYDVTPDLLTYISYARGYKSAGYNLDRSRNGLTVPKADTFFPAEFVDSYEAGAKSTLLSGRLLLNGTLFYQKFEGFQLNAYTGISYLVASIPEVISRGIDTDFFWRTPITGLQMQGGLTYAETQYGSFVPSAGVSTRLPNTRLSYAPLWSGSVAATYDRPLNDALDFHGNVSVRFNSTYNAGSDLNPVKVQEGYATVNIRAGVGAKDDRWRIEGWAANLTDETVTQVVFDPLLQTGSYDSILAPPRTFGVTLRVSY